MAERRLLFSVTRKDFEIQTFRSGGPGGQYQNRRDSGVRVIHKASGARGEARDRRSQLQNRKAAFERLVQSSEFQVWLKVEAGKAIMTETEKELLLRRIEQAVTRQLRPENLLIEYETADGWITV